MTDKTKKFIVICAGIGGLCSIISIILNIMIW